MHELTHESKDSPWERNKSTDVSKASHMPRFFFIHESNFLQEIRGSRVPSTQMDETAVN